MACHELGPGFILDGVAAGGLLRVVGCVGRGHEHKRLGAHKIRECPGSRRVVRRAVLGQVVHLRGENAASTPVCTRALKCGAFLTCWWWCWCWCLWWSKVFVLMLPPPQLVAAAGDDA